MTFWSLEMGLEYTHVDGDLYVSGTIYEGQTPTGANSSTGSDDSSTSSGSGDTDQGGAYASGPAGEGNEDTSPIADPEPSVPDPDPSDGDIRSTIDKYASSYSSEARDITFQSLKSNIDSNTQAISSLQNYVQEMHTDMNAGFAMSAAISAKVFPDVKGWSLSGGVGFYENQEALALGVNYISDDFGFTINLAQSQREGTMANVGFSVSINSLFEKNQTSQIIINNGTSSTL